MEALLNGEPGRQIPAEGSVTLNGPASVDGEARRFRAADAYAESVQGF
ncbi:hypothetical protein [Caballeronia sp. J97]|nr:hypothetical protein [Caballeronia sp. J97]